MCNCSRVSPRLLACLHDQMLATARPCTPDTNRRPAFPCLVMGDVRWGGLRDGRRQSPRERAVKHWMRKAKVRDREKLWLEACGILERIQPDECASCLRHAGYVAAKNFALASERDFSNALKFWDHACQYPQETGGFPRMRRNFSGILADIRRQSA